MAPTARSSPPFIEPTKRDLDLDDLSSLDELLIADEIPSLDDIIPWSGPKRKPRQMEVFDAVRTVQDINVMFLKNVLRSYYSREGIIREVKVESHNHAPMDTPNDSQRNDLTEVNVEATVDAKKQLFHMVIKTLTTSQPVRALSSAHSFDRREVGFYIEILEDMNTFQQQEIRNPNEYIVIPTSKCFFARFAPQGVHTYIKTKNYSIPPDESVVVMENVKYDGFTHTSVDHGLSKEQVMTVFEGVAKLHGLSLAMKERSGIPLQRSYPYLLCISEAAKCIVKLFDKKSAEITEMLTTFGAGNLGVKLMELRPCLDDLVQIMARPEEPMTVLSHMNLWAHNILFKDEECVFVDWQMITCARPTFDLAFLLATSVRPAERRRYRNLFLNHYYDNFATFTQRCGLDIQADLDYTREHLWEDFRYSQLLALFFWIAKSGDLLTSRETELQFIDYMQDLDEQNLLEPDVFDLDIPEYIYWMPRNPARSNVIFRIERPPSSIEDVDHICGLFPVYELPED